jgi:ankyrin repeat protein
LDYFKEEEAFHLDIINNDIEKVKEKLSTGTIEAHCKNNYACLIAASKGHLDMLKFLIKIPEVNPFDLNNTAFELAASHGNIEIIEFLLNDPRVIPNSNGNDPIRLAYNSKQYLMVALLFKNKKIRSTLKNDDTELYTKINLLNIKSKIEKF